ncbi:MAG TPA: amidohydrolase family protein [Candidatus Dormibacteraeota bacterium]|nr:amidohydrolase family protein [Candidatus Dormibacteraeota bacterium]
MTRQGSVLSAWLRATRHVPATSMARFARPQPPRFPAIDAHTHLNSVHAYGWRGRPVGDVIRALDRAGVQGLVNLDGGHGEALSAEIARVQTPNPDRIVVFAGVDPAAWKHDARFGAMEAARLEDSVRRGARGLKIWKDVGLHARDPDGRLVALDDERLAPIWETAGALGVPVLIHVADPKAFFERLDRNNERWDELRRHPDWHYSPIRTAPDGPGFPSHDELIGQFERMVQRHPGTRFIGAHLASSGEDLARLSDMLRRLPNLSVDIAARINELGRQPAEARSFIETFQDRVLLGTDAGPDPRWYPIYFRFLETAAHDMNYSVGYRAPQGNWRIDGLSLSDRALVKVYAENALRLIRFGP